MNDRTEVWLRFFGYKIAEILGVGIFSIGSYYLGWLMNSWMPEESRVTGWFILWFTGLFGLLMIILAIGLIMIWIIKNLEWATEHTKTHNKQYNRVKK
jgi:hypothetical protein